MNFIYAPFGLSKNKSSVLIPFVGKAEYFKFGIDSIKLKI